MGGGSNVIAFLWMRCSPKHNPQHGGPDAFCRGVLPLDDSIPILTVCPSSEFSFSQKDLVSQPFYLFMKTTLYFKSFRKLDISLFSVYDLKAWYSHELRLFTLTRRNTRLFILAGLDVQSITHFMKRRNRH